MKKVIQNEPNHNNQEKPRAYSSPEIILEIDLETRAGSALPDNPDPLDLTGLGTGSDGSK